MDTVRYAGFYAETCQSSGVQGEEAGSEEGGAKCTCDGAYRVAGFRLDEIRL